MLLNEKDEEFKEMAKLEFEENAAKKETFKYVKNVSCKAVKINLLSVPLSFTALAKGSTKKPYRCSEKK